MSTTYGVTRSFGGCTYSVSGYSSKHDALMAVHEQAFEDGNWSPPELRQKWWQFWRPTEHNEIEAYFAVLSTGREGE